MERRERVEWIDVAKGLGMLLVILGHTMTTPIRNSSSICYSIYIGVYFFHMPFMFYLSGRTFGMAGNRYQAMSDHSFLGKKLWQLMVPYVVYDCIVYLIFAGANAIHKVNQILEGSGYGKETVMDFLKGLVLGDNVYAYHLWYIYGLFVMTAVSYLVVKHCGKAAPYILFALAGIGAFVRVADTPFHINTTFWGAYNMVMKCYLWFVVGMYCDFSKLIKKWWSILWQFAAAIYMVLIAINFHGWAGYSGTLRFESAKWIADAGLLMLFVNIACLLRGKVKAFFTFTGKRSYGIYLFHQPFFASGCGLVMVKVLHVPVLAAVCIAVVLCYVAPLCILRLLDTSIGSRIKPYLLGTPRKKCV